MLRWCGWAGLGFVVFTAIPCRATQAEQDPPAALKAAHRILAVLEQGDTGVLPFYARRKDPDPWIVAHELCQLGHADQALAFARAVDRPELARLPQQIALWRKTPLAPDKLKAWRAAQLAIETRRFDDAVEAGSDDVPSGDRLFDASMAILGGIARAEAGDLEGAQLWLKAAVHSSSSLGWLVGETRALSALGHAQRQLHDFEGAIETWTLCAVSYDRRDDPMRAAASRANIAALYLELSDPAPAIVLLEAAIRVYDEHGTDRQVGYQIRHYNNLGWARAVVGPYAAALAAFRMGRALAVKIDDTAHAVDFDVGLATVHVRLSDWESAESAARSALQEADNIDYAVGVARAHGTLGLLFSASSRFDASLLAYEKAREAFTLIRDDETQARDVRDSAARHIASVIVNLGATYLGLGRPDEALASYREALDLFDALDLPRGTLEATIGMAWLHLDAGNLREAAKTYKRARRLAADMEAVGSLLQIHQGLARVRLEQGRHAAALASAQDAADAMATSMRGLEHQQQIRARSGRSRVFEIGMQAAAALGDDAAFSDTLEQARAYALLELLEDPEGLRSAVIPEPLLLAERTARTHEAAVRLRLSQARDSGDLKAGRKFRAELREAEAQVRAALANIQRTAKASADLLYPKAASLALIQRALDVQDVLVRYVLLPETAYAAVTTRDTTRIVELGDSVDIEVAARAVVTQSADATKETKRAWAALRALVVEPLELPSGKRQLLISPDGVLHFVPPSALAGERDVVYVASGTTLRRLADADHGRGKAVLALGDPDYDDQRGLLPLPESRREVEEIGTTVLVGEAATKSGLKNALAEHGRWRSVHFAGHGVIDRKHPMMSSLALTADAGGDGNLTCLDILRMKIQAELAVLSACETGTGTIYRSEGVVGLTRAFMAAGAPRVLCSLWKVDDEATRELMVAFYKHWNPRDGTSGTGPAEALKKAQAAIREHPEHPEWEHPYFWAAWVLWGLPD